MIMLHVFLLESFFLVLKNQSAVSLRLNSRRRVEVLCQHTGAPAVPTAPESLAVSAAVVCGRRVFLLQTQRGASVSTFHFSSLHHVFSQQK